MPYFATLVANPCFVQVVLRAWRECMLESRSENAGSSVDLGHSGGMLGAGGDT